MVDSYRRALAPLGDVELVLVNAGGYSSSYVSFAMRHMDHDKRIIPRLKAALLPSYKIDQAYDTTSVICYSAGYALVREMLRGGDRDYLNAVVAIDSVHGSLDPNGPGGVRQLDLQPWADLAERATTSDTLFWLGHSDVPTPQTGPSAFASTTQIAQALRSMVPEAGNWRIRSYNVRSNPSEEHSAALVEWGPGFVQEALVSFLSKKGAVVPPTDVPPAPWRDHTIPIGQRCVLWAENEKSMGVREIPPGSNTSPRIRDYLAPCKRLDTEQPLNLTASNWCSALVSAAQEECILIGEPRSHGYRAAVVEVKIELDRNGLWVPVKSVMGGVYTPQIGDLVIYDRSIVGRPETSWWRHICMVKSWGTNGVFTTIGGNEGDMISITVRRLDDPKLLGFGKRATRPVEGMTDAERAHVMSQISLALDELARKAVT